jgi:hypothetical protein
MSDPAIKESRRRLRRVQKHLAQAQLNLGTTREQSGLVNVIYHPTNQHALLNYVSPRKNTAWVPGPEIKKGLERLRALDRIPRVTYIEGLYPPLFAKTIRDLGMVVEREAALMTYKVEGETPKDLQPVSLPKELRYEEVTTQEGNTLWWVVWRKAGTEAVSKSIEPLHLGRTVHEVKQGRRVDLILFRKNIPIGIIRLTLHEQTAHIVALAILPTRRTPETVKLWYQVALYAALKRQSTLIFSSSPTEDEHQICRDLGFVDSGSTVCYVEVEKKTDKEKNKKEDSADEQMAQPVFVLRQNKPPKTSDSQ